jgi:hypothetical protein
LTTSRTRTIACVTRARGDEIRIDLVRHAGTDYVLVEAKCAITADEPMPRKLGAIAIRANEVKPLLAAIEQAVTELETRSGEL